MITSDPKKKPKKTLEDLIFVPEGDDSDPTRQNDFYDQTYQFLKDCGIEEI